MAYNVSSGIIPGGDPMYVYDDGTADSPAVSFGVDTAADVLLPEFTTVSTVPAVLSGPAEEVQGLFF